MLARLRHILEMIRFSHTLFALPFALLAALMAWSAGANADPPIAWRGVELLGILVCMVTARSAAMAVNRIVDREIDAQNPRTAGRHIPQGTLSTRVVVMFAVVCSAGFVAGTLLFWPNRLPLYFAPGVLAFILGYSYAKRFTVLSHFWLGAALMMAPMAAWIAIRGQVLVADPLDILPALVLGAAVLMWVAGFDVIYACQDAEFDARAGLRSLPARLGVRRALQLAAACHVVAVALLLALPLVFEPLGWIFWSGIAAVAALLVYEHAIVRPDDLARVNVAFFRVNAIISVGLLVLGALDLWF